ncbi:uncharacterized protein FTJAE_13631 [Fusarium tjaetaba]|uniref:Uncharacterized protein n=1 Tax=Fusarium tjaetaba TaxID=1567544 RepID=A0A8H5QDY1_9HYPO|nr:uncharacterized protein FTJAE_13631 [Fusarium tjaetaba]KAF5614680.1 hypothetical protein FTJAE_13631 [Fusarium tjaetaba]
MVAAGRNPKDLRLPIALTEDWGKKNLKYYSGMTRAQSTMMFSCRTERIGLRKYLHDCCIPGFESPRCLCGRSRETVFHLLVECPRLREARMGLFQRLGHNDFTTLLTKDAKIVAEWAISYFDLAMFDSVRERSSRFPVFPHLISPRPEGFLDTLRASSTARRRTRTSRTSRTSRTTTNNPRRRSAPRASPATTSTSPQTPQTPQAPSPPPRRNPTRSARTTTSYELEPLASEDI